MFGEERHLLWHKKHHDEATNSHQKFFCAPYTVVCTSTTGELYKLSSNDFYRQVLKDAQTESHLLANLG